MIQALKTIGEYVKDNISENLAIHIFDNPNSNGKYEKVLLILFEKVDNELKYKEIEVEEFDKAKLDKYAYKQGSPRGGDLTPTSKITELKKTFDRIQKPLEKLCKNFKNNAETEEIINKINKIFQDEKISKIIFNELQEKYQQIDNNGILTIAYTDDQGNRLYVGDFEEFTSSLLNLYEKRFYYRSSYNRTEKESIGKNNICYICSKKVSKTYGYVGTYSFYTLDKPGFTSGGFNRAKAWKNYPVCPDCAKILDLGKDYIEKNLSARFCGINYKIIPKTIFDSGKNRQDVFATLEYLDKHKKMSLSKDTKNTLTNAQDELFYLMQDVDNYINFNLMFYEIQNSAFRILLYVEDVLPSYIRKIFKAKEELEEEDIFQNLKNKEGEIFSLKFKFNLIADFFYINQTNKEDYTKQFLEITNGIFSGQKISYYHLIDRFVVHLQDRFRNGESLWYDNLKAIMILKFLNKLSLVPELGKEGDYIMVEGKGKFREKIESFIEKHNEILNSNAKILAFLEGVLVQKLLNVQKQQTDGAAAPFMARLNGLKINKKILMRIYTETVNKLEEYGANYYRQLEELTADYILISDLDEISNNELSFYFVTGMNQAVNFQFEKTKEEDDNDGSGK